VCVTMQPDRIVPLLEHRGLRDSGYLARFLLCYPPSPPRRAPFPAMRAPIQSSYNQHVRSLLDLPFEEPGRRMPFAITMPERVVAPWNEFYNELEDRAAPGGDLDRVRDATDKLRVSVLRIAGLLHVARYAPEHQEDAFERSMTLESIEGAIAIARYLIPHIEHAFAGERSADDAVVEQVRQAVVHLGLKQFRATDVHRRLRRRLNPDQVRRGLNLLVDRGALVGEGMRETQGAPSGPWYSISPDASSTLTRT
jgi:Protein of unknown function (DUF3987)